MLFSHFRSSQPRGWSVVHARGAVADDLTSSIRIDVVDPASIRTDADVEVEGPRCLSAGAVAVYRVSRFCAASSLMIVPAMLPVDELLQEVRHSARFKDSVVRCSRGPGRVS